MVKGYVCTAYLQDYRNVIRTGEGWISEKKAFPEIPKDYIINLNINEQDSCSFLGIFPRQQKIMSSPSSITPSPLDAGTAAPLLLLAFPT